MFGLCKETTCISEWNERRIAMNILIKDIDMPYNCFTDNCPCLNRENGYCQADKEHRTIHGDKPYWCPLVEVTISQNKNSRLIDANRLEDVIVNLNARGFDITRGEFKLIDSVIFEWPTAIEL